MNDHFCGSCLYPVSLETGYRCPDCPEYVNGWRCDLHAFPCLNRAHEGHDAYGLVQRCQWHAESCAPVDHSDIGTRADYERARDVPRDSY